MASRPGRAGERGQILIMTAVMLTTILGVTALLINASFMYDKRNKLYGIADTAARSAAIERRRNAVTGGVCATPGGACQTLLQNFADEQGFADFGIAPGTITINHPPSSGPFVGNANYVEAILEQATSTFFGSIPVLGSMTPGARAVAGTSASPNCIVTFDHVQFTSPSEGSSVIMPNCNMTINAVTIGSNELSNRATIDAKGIGVFHSSGSGCTGNCANVTYNVPRASDPLATLQPPGVPSGVTCTGPYTFPSNATISVSDVDKYFCGFNVSGSTITFNPGTYYINGPVADSGGSDIWFFGTGVTLYLSQTGHFLMDDCNNFHMHMSAPTSGTYNGILMYQSRSTPIGTRAVFGKNNADLEVQGAFYLPSVNMQMSNENSPTMTNPCTLIVAWAIEIDKPHLLLDNACTTFGGSPLLTLSLAE